MTKVSSVDEDYGSNVGRFIEDHSDYVIKIGSGGFGYQAQKRGPDGHGVGDKAEALTLDELADKLRAAAGTVRGWVSQAG
jgi:hypothetical protein